MNLSQFDSEEMVALIKFDMRQDRYDHALEKVKYLVQQENVPVEIYSIAGKLYASLGLFLKAERNFKTYLQFKPDAINERFQLGMVNRDLGNPINALEIWQEVLNVDSTNAETLFYMGETYYWQNEIENARDCLFKLLETAPDNSKYIPMSDELLNRINAH